MAIKKKEINVIELFAGVGGFRVGLENASKKFKTVFSNQWEPSTKRQEASEIYVKRFGAKGHSNEDINLVKTKDIPYHDLLVGGFPCQDYSVATSLKNSQGLFGKKGVLWWQIYRILDEKGTKRPNYLFLENVDRLLGSPAKQRGRDMAVILSSLQKLGYIVEWRIINAAEYGMPQRRRRVFILGYHKNSEIYKQVKKEKDPYNWILNEGVIASAFPVAVKKGFSEESFTISDDFKKESDDFNKGKKSSPFQNSGIMVGSKVYTIKTINNYDGPYETLGENLLDDKEVPKEFYIDPNTIEKWQYLKGAKSETRTNKAVGFEYKYSEGSMVFPDALDKPSRTIITGEGGSSASRFKHVVKTKSGKLRRLTPIELERLNMFEDNHTEGIPDVKRAFIMGNALVTGVIKKIGEALLEKATK
jgi:DNA (cytosine-5)-methyltransferase 1